MNKPLLALAGIALLGAAGVAGAVVVAPLGGEEEVVSREQATDGATPTVSPQADPEGWVRFSHPGTAEAPPFSFAYPGDWFVQEPELIPRHLPKGEPLGTGVQMQVSSWDQKAVPSEPMPPEAIRLKVFVGPHAPLTICPPETGPINYRFAGIDARRLELTDLRRTLSMVIYAVTPDFDLCYAIFAEFTHAVPDEAILDRIAESFRVDEGAAAASPAPAQSPPVTPSPAATAAPAPHAASTDWLTYTDPLLGFSFPYPPQLVSVEEQLEPGLEGQENQRFVIFRTAQGEFGLGLVVIPVGDLALNEWVDFYTACGGDARSAGGVDRDCRPRRITLPGQPIERAQSWLLP